MPLNRLAFLQMLAVPVLQSPQEPTAEMRYRQATDLLTRGRRFERAAELLRPAMRQAPDQPRIASALGCALVSRVASLMYAGSFTYSLEADRRNYPRALAEWEKMKKLPGTEDVQELRPTPPPQITIHTKDDSQPFLLRPEELARKTTALATEARRAFESAAKIARTPEAQAEVAYLEEWSLRLLRLYDGDVGLVNDLLYGDMVPDSEDEPEEVEAEQEARPAKLYYPKPKDEEIRKAFTQATEKDSDNALYWQSLGDVLNEPKEIKAAYLKALEGNPRNASLWYRLYQKEMAQVSRMEDVTAEGTGAVNKPDPLDKERALSYLRMAARYDPANGWYACEEASQLFKETKYSSFLLSHTARNAPPSKDPEIAHYQKQMREEYEKQRQTGATAANKEAGNRAVLLVEKGSQSARWEFPRYHEPVPRLLAAARSYMRWAAVDLDFMQFAGLRELARSLVGYGLYRAVEDRDNTQAVRACRAAIGLGQRMAGEWPLRDDNNGDSRVIRTLVGQAVIAIGMKSLVDVEKLSGNSSRVAQYQAEYDAFQAKVKAYKAARLKVMEDNNLYSLY